MTGEELSDAAAGAAVEGGALAALAGARGRSRFPPPAEPGACANCGTRLRGQVCHSCGQNSDDFHRPVWSLVKDVLDGLFSFDGRFWRTVPPLLVRPGHVTRAYLTGVRARYVQPFRLFIAASVLFFLVAFLGGDFDGQLRVNGAPVSVDAPATMAELDAAERELAARIEAGGPAAAGLRIARDQVIAQRERLQAQADDAGETGEAEPAAEDTLESRLAQQIRQREAQKAAMRRALLPELYADAPPAPGDLSFTMSDLTWMPLAFRQRLADRYDYIADNPRAFIEALKRWIPRMVFLLLPVYALLLSILHIWRRGFYFYDHLIVALHFHAFLFFFLILLIGAGQVIGAGWTILIFLIWSNYALYRIHRVVYECSRFGSVLRTLTLDVLYLMIMGLAMGPLMLLGLLTA